MFDPFDEQTQPQQNNGAQTNNTMQNNIQQTQQNNNSMFFDDVQTNNNEILGNTNPQNNTTQNENITPVLNLMIPLKFGIILSLARDRRKNYNPYFIFVTILPDDPNKPFSYDVNRKITLKTNLHSLQALLGALYDIYRGKQNVEYYIFTDTSRAGFAVNQGNYIKTFGVSNKIVVKTNQGNTPIYPNAVLSARMMDNLSKQVLSSANMKITPYDAYSIAKSIEKFIDKAYEIVLTDNNINNENNSV